MKLPFRRDVGAALALAESKLDEVDAKIAALETDRQVALRDSDELAPVATLDRAIAEQRAAKATYEARVAVLKDAVRQAHAEASEKDRQVALAAVAKMLEKRVAIAIKLEQAIKDYGDAYFELVAPAHC
jgi:hypothetical protein